MNRRKVDRRRRTVLWTELIGVGVALTLTVGLLGYVFVRPEMRVWISDVASAMVDTLEARQVDEVRRYRAQFDSLGDRVDSLIRSVRTLERVRQPGDPPQ